MINISKKDEINGKTASNLKEGNKKESQYLLRVVYDSEDEKVHKLLEGIFGKDQILDVKNGKVAKINSSLTPKQRDYFLGMVSEAINKAEDNEAIKSNSEKEIINVNNYSVNEINNVKEEFNDTNNKENFNEENYNNSEEMQNSRKVNADKLIQEFAKFLNNIS